MIRRPPSSSFFPSTTLSRPPLPDLPPGKVAPAKPALERGPSRPPPMKGTESDDGESCGRGSAEGEAGRGRDHVHLRDRALDGAQNPESSQHGPEQAGEGLERGRGGP